MTKVLILFVLCAVVTEHRHVRAQQDILEKGKIAVLGAIAKGKEVLDHGVNIKSERQQSYDIFGLKFGTNNGVDTGFGDAATERNLESMEDDLLRRRKRSLDVLEALRSAGLFSNSEGGTNVNIVKINSVSNVNNYGPETTTASAQRRRRLTGRYHRPLVFSAVDQKVSYVSSDTELHKDTVFKSHTEGGSQSNHLEKVEENEVDGPAVRNRRSLGMETADESQGPIKMESLTQSDDQKPFESPRNKRSLVLGSLENKVSYFSSDSEAKADGSMKTHTFTGSRESKLSKLSIEPESDSKRRAKRSPQEIDEDTVTTGLPPRNGTRPGPPDGDEDGPPSGRPRGPPPDCGRGGPRGGRRGHPGKGRGPPPPPEENDVDEPNEAAERKKREATGDENDNQSKSSYYSDSSSSEEDKGQRRRKREINGTSDVNNATGSDSSDSSASSYYSDSSSSESSDSTSEEDSNTESNDGGEDTQDEAAAVNKTDVQRTKRSPCSRGNRGSQTTTPPPGELEELERRKREAESQEDIGEKVEKDVTWFTDVMDKLFRAVKKVADSARQVFSGGKQGEGGEANPDAERI